MIYIVMWVALIAMIGVNILANVLPLNGHTTGEISNFIDVVFTPAGYVFSIWSLIYILLIAWLVMVHRKMQKKQFKSIVGVLFIMSCLFNIAWLLSWHYEYFALSVLFMFLLLFTLIAIYLQYKPTQTGFSERFPFSYYLAWITVATIANVSYVLKYYGVSLGISEVMGSLVLVAVAVVIGYAAVSYSKDIYFVIVVVWALIGIVVRTTDETMQYGTIAMTAILVIASLIKFIKDRMLVTN